MSKGLSRGYREGVPARAATEACSSPTASKTRYTRPPSDQGTIPGPSPGSWGRPSLPSSAATDLAAVAVHVGARGRGTEKGLVSRSGREASRRGGRSG